MYTVSVTGVFEFWTLKDGPDRLTRISVRVSGQGRRKSCLVATTEAEADVLKRWAAEHVERMDAGASPMLDRRRESAADPNRDRVRVRRELLDGLHAVGFIPESTLEAFRDAGFLFDHAIRSRFHPGS